MIKSNSLRCLIFSLVLVAVTCPSIALNSFPADSVRVKWMEGKKYILHKVQPQETWTNLSKRYNCTIANLKAANSGVEQLKTGQIINVPTSSAATASTPTPNSASSATTPAKPIAIAPQPDLKSASPTVAANGKPVTYVVKKGETMYSIAKRYNKTVPEIKSMNNLITDVLSDGQVLIVSYETSTHTPATVVSSPKVNAVASTSVARPVVTEPAATSVKPLVQEEKKTVSAIPVSVSSSSPVPVQNTGISPAAGYEKPSKSISPVKKGNTEKTLMQVTETGVATWIQDGQIKSDRYFALHRSAPIGTIIKVTNRMNNQFVYVKVVGSLPDTGENENIIIKVSQAVSSKLVALDPLFQVELSYGLMQ